MNIFHKFLRLSMHHLATVSLEVIQKEERTIFRMVRTTRNSKILQSFFQKVCQFLHALLFFSAKIQNVSSNESSIYEMTEELKRKLLFKPQKTIVIFIKTGWNYKNYCGLPLYVLQPTTFDYFTKQIDSIPVVLNLFSKLTF